jgi:predicted MFS family arabinose efflux permease
VRPGGERARVNVAFASLGVWWGAWGALVPDIQRRAGVSDGELGIALLFVGVGALASMRSTGTWMDRRGELVLPVTVAALGLGGVLPAIAHGVIPLAAALAVVGLASGALDVAINTAGIRVESSSGRPLMNLAHAWFSIGVIAASVAAGAARAVEVTPLPILATVAGAMVAGAVWLYPFEGARSGGAPSSAVTHRGWWHVPSRLAFIGAMTALAFFVESAWQNWSAVHLERDLDSTPFVGSLGPAVFGVAAGAGRLIGHRLEVRRPELSLVRLGSLVAAVGSVIAALAPWSSVALLGIAAAGVGTSVLAPILLRQAGTGIDADARGAAVGSVITIAYLGFVVAPAMVGGLASATTLPTALAFVAVAGLLVAGLGPRAG